MHVKYKEAGTIKKIKDIAPKMSDAVQAMYDGLRSTLYNPLLRVNMGTFGEKIGFICVGCAATYTLMKLDGGVMAAISGKINSEDQRAHTFKIDVDDIKEFELAIDCFRRGYYSSLFDFYNVPIEVKNKFNFNFHTMLTEGTGKINLPLIYLDTREWKKQLPTVLEIVRILKSHNL